MILLFLACNGSDYDLKDEPEPPAPEEDVEPEDLPPWQPVEVDREQTPPELGCRSAAVTLHDLVFAETTYGCVEEQLLRIANDADCPIELLGLDLDGLQTDATLPDELDAGLAIEIPVRFVPDDVHGEGVITLTSSEGEHTATWSGAGRPLSVFFTPDPVDLPALTVGCAMDEPLTLHHDATCTVTLAALTGGPPIDLPLPVDVDPGDSVEGSIVWTPSGTLPASGLLELAATIDGEVTVHTAPWSAAGGTAPELTVLPAPFAFPDAAPACPSERPLQLRNDGDCPLVVDELLVSGPASTDFSGPTSIDPGDRLTVQASFEPTAIGAVTGSFDIRGDADVVVPWTGMSPGTLIEEDRWRQGGYQDVDLMLTVDKSGSMSNDIGLLAIALHDLPDVLPTGLRVMVVTSSNGCGQTPFVTIGDPDAGPTLEQQMLQSYGYIEAGLTQAVGALQQNGPGQCNEGFGVDTAVVVVMISDEPEQSWAPWHQMVDTLQTLSPGILLHAVTVPGYDAGYPEAVAETGGIMMQLGTSWPDNLELIAQNLGQALESFPLSDEPDPATITVTLDGLPTSAWTYDPVANEVTITPPPSPGMLVAVRYALAGC